MDRATALRLTQLTNEFYAQVAESFSATRHGAWAGWERVLEVCGLAGRGELSVVDVACGNLRFERFLAETGVGARVRAFDACDELKALGGLESDGINTESITYTHLDLAEALERDGALASALGDSGSDLAVCFGFMHHLPLREQRERLLKELAASIKPSGYVAVSFWQLSKSERLLAKAEATTARALPKLGLSGLNAGDYLLGWQDRSDVVRYCHDFSEEEIDELAASVAGAAREVARYSADGATGNLNRYLIFEV